MKLSEACTFDEVIKVLALRAWYTTHNSEDCPTEYIPVEDDLCDWITDCDEQIQTQTSEYLNSLFSPPKSGSWHWWRIFSKQDPSLKIFAALCYIEHQENGKKRYQLALHWNEQGQTIGPAAYSLKQVHAAWKAIPQDRRPPHPLGPIVEAWQQRPKQVETDHRPDPLFPAIFIQADFNDNRTGKLFAPPAHVAGGVDGEQLCFPGFAPGEPNGAPITPALPLALYDLGVGKLEHGQRGAPMPLRIFIEAVLSVKPESRGSGPRLIGPVPLRDFLRFLYPPGKEKNWQRERHLPALQKALVALDSPESRIPWQDPETGNWHARKVVSPQDIPLTGAADDKISFVVDLPPGTEKGPIMDRPALRRAQTRSVAIYRLILSLCAWWHEPGVTRRPAEGGRHWYQSCNPEHYREVSDAELVAMAFPVTPSKTRKRLFDARQALDELIHEGFAAVKDRRIYPGPKWTGWQ